MFGAGRQVEAVRAGEQRGGRCRVGVRREIDPDPAGRVGEQVFPAMIDPQGVGRMLRRGRVAGTAEDRRSACGEDALADLRGQGCGRGGLPGRAHDRGLEGHVTCRLLGRVGEVEVLAEQRQAQEERDQDQREHEELGCRLAALRCARSREEGVAGLHGSAIPSCRPAAQARSVGVTAASLACQ